MAWSKKLTTFFERSFVVFLSGLVLFATHVVPLARTVDPRFASNAQTLSLS